MTIDSLDVVFYSFLFLVPGYIIEEIMSSLMPMKRSNDATKILRCLGYSVFNNAIWFSWGMKLFKQFLTPESILFWCFLSLAVLITGAITGFAVGIIRAKEIVYKVFNKLLCKTNISVTHPVPAAWDYVFKNIQDGVYVTVRMDNEKFIRGFFSTESIASSDEEYRDIFIENAYILNDDDEWQPIPDSKGVWLSPDAIKHIEFTEMRHSDIMQDIGVHDTTNVDVKIHVKCK